MRLNPARLQALDEGLGVIALVGAERRPLGQALAHARRRHKPVAVLHQRMAEIAKTALLARALSEQARILVGRRGVGFVRALGFCGSRPRGCAPEAPANPGRSPGLRPRRSRDASSSSTLTGGRWRKRGKRARNSVDQQAGIRLVRLRLANLGLECIYLVGYNGDRRPAAPTLAGGAAGRIGWGESRAPPTRIMFSR